MLGVPLSEVVSFKAVLQKGDRVQVPKRLRWRFKLEGDQVLRILVTVESVYGGEEFYGRVDKSGRISVPKLTLKLLGRQVDKPRVAPGMVIEVKLKPA